MNLRYVYRGNPRFLEGVGQRLADAGCTQIDEPAAASLAITYCTSQTELEEVYFGDDGLISIMDKGSILIDVSATTPNFARDLNSLATIHDLLMVEAPLVVADLTEEDVFSKANLICFAAGEDEAVKKAQPILKVLFETVITYGRPGTAQLARCARTMQTAAQAISAIEAEALYQAMRHSVGGSGLGKVNVDATSVVGAAILKAAKNRQFTSGYTVEMLMAELSSALMAADDAELIIPQTEAALHLLELLAVVGGTDLSPAALTMVYGDESDAESIGLDWSRAEQIYGGGNLGQPSDEFDLSGVYGPVHGDDDEFDDFDDLDDYDINYNSDYDEGYNNFGYDGLEEEFR